MDWAFGPNGIFSDHVASPPVAKLLGFAVTSMGNGLAIVELMVDGRHANPMGTLHGGVLCTAADAAMGTAYLSTLEEGESFTTLELKINFLRPVWNAHLIATGKVVKKGKTIGLTECDVTDGDGILIARAMSTCMTLRGEEAKGR